jgi:hypothetical protein
MKATVTPVQIGTLTIEGLMTEVSEFYVAVPQAADLFQFDKNQASREVKSLLGKGFQFDKVTTPLNPKAVNALKLEQFGQLVFELALKGNTKAIEFQRMLAGLSLQQLFSDAFGIKFEAAERQQWLAARMKTKQDFHPVLTASMERNGLIKRPSDWGKYIKWFQDTLGIKSGTRDQLDLDKQVDLAAAQVSVANLLDAGIAWKRALALVATSTR